MAKKKTSETIDGMRVFKCKVCGTEAREPLPEWRKKRGGDKNICMTCIEKREKAKQSMREAVGRYA